MQQVKSIFHSKFVLDMGLPVNKDTCTLFALKSHVALKRLWLNEEKVDKHL